MTRPLTADLPSRSRSPETADRLLRKPSNSCSLSAAFRGGVRKCLVDDRLLGAGAGEGADLELVEAAQAGGVLADQRADDAAEEAERNRHDARVAQREPGEVCVGEQRGRRAGDDRGEEHQQYG